MMQSTRVGVSLSLSIVLLVGFVQFRVETIFLDYLTVVALLFDAAILNDEYSVGVLYGRQTMRNHDACASHSSVI